MAKCAKIHIASGRMVSVETPDSATHARALPDACGELRRLMWPVRGKRVRRRPSRTVRGLVKDRRGPPGIFISCHRAVEYVPASPTQPKFSREKRRMICEQHFHMTFINAATSRDHPGAQARRSELPDLLPPGRRKKACELSPAWNLTFKGGGVKLACMERKWKEGSCIELSMHERGCEFPRTRTGARD
ncbi:uncharacterized protein LOC112350961 [Selaginella moellendorffii]|uniref:uncharacterized protein LOC112350961 n=1 Tax=Selaginella moellendorffii TaxID=88036 RepID=UPI000D1CEFA2|nr:uncharacterized protein LOC112350961 [Selaginella moellendorffii]|eukprot:XP_024543796.1 uncharacterized protein LOC112350961 [Selaginella moellendorffii]